MLASSCGNLDPIIPLTNSGNTASWTLESNAYATSTYTYTASSNTLTATSTSAPYGSISIIFPGSALPILPIVGDTIITYTVVNTRPIGNQVNIRVTTNGGNTIYAGRGENDSIKVLRIFTSFASTTGKIAIKGSGIEMLNNSNPSDSASLTLNLTQIQ